MSKSVNITEFLLEIMKSTLESGEDIMISGFGKFCIKDKKERRARNPPTGNDILLGDRRVVTSPCSSVLKGKLNGKKIGIYF
jgi:integration host factor subunit alpha